MVKVILMTSFEIKDEEFSKVFPSVQVDGFVQKPIGINDLNNKILSVIGEAKRQFLTTRWYTLEVSFVSARDIETDCDFIHFCYPVYSVMTKVWKCTD